MTEVDCADFCLPSEFLAEDIFLEEKTRKIDGDGTGGGDGDACFPSEFPYDWVCCVSDDGSKAGSVAVMEGSDEECSAGLSRRMENYFLQEEEKVASSPLAVDDPRATRCVGSSREVSDVLSLQQKQAGRGLLCPPAGNTFSPFTTGLTKSATIGYHAQPSLSKYKDVVDQQLKRQQLVELQMAAAWRRHNKGAKGGGGLPGSRPARPPGSPRASWTPLPQQAGSGMRAVFLGAGTRRETCGTGVFLPRRVGCPAEPRKKPGLSTVLLPARVMQALNLNLDDLVAQPRSSGGFVLQNDAVVDRNSGVMSQRRSYRPQPVHTVHQPHEVCLPAEWTY